MSEELRCDCCDDDDGPPTAQEAREAFAIIPPHLLAQLQHQIVPQKVAMAYSFVKHCNREMGWRGFSKGNSIEGFQSEFFETHLPGQQEQVFNIALKVLGDYFSGKEPR